MNFNHEELMLMMLYNTGTRLGLIHELRLMQCYLMPDETALRELSDFQLLRRLFRGVRVGVPFGGIDIINGILTLLLRHDSAVERLSLQKHPQ